MGVAGSHIALETADVALMRDDLSLLAPLIRRARAALAIVRQNIAIAIGLKVVFLGLAAVGKATLWMAVAADMGASLIVIANGMRALGGPRSPVSSPPSPVLVRQSLQSPRGIEGGRTGDRGQGTGTMA